VTDAGTVELGVHLDRAKIEREVAAAGREMEVGLGGAAKKVEAEWQRTAKSVAGAFVLYKGGQFLSDSVQAASDLSEQQNKANVVFGESIDIVNRFADNSAQKLGQSQRSVLEAAGTFGNLFKAIGLTDQQSAEFSTTLTGLASDLASFNNSSPDEALQALRAGLVGETEPLKRFGVNLNEATLQQKALEMGLYSGTGQLSASARAQAAYALILEQTKAAQGDFARTSGGLANQQRILAAEFEDTKASLGEALLPAMKLAVEIANDALKVFGLLPEPVQAGIVVVGGLTFAAGLLGPTMTAGAAAMKAAGIAALQYGQNLIVPTTAVEGLGAAQTATTATTVGFGGYLAAGVAGIGAYSLTLDQLNSRFASFHGNTEQLRTDLENLGKGIGGVDAITAQFGGSIDELANKVAAQAGDSLSSRLNNAKSFQGWGRILGTKQAIGDLDAIDKQLVKLASSGKFDEAKAAFGQLSAELIRNGTSAEDVGFAFDDFTDYLTSNSGQMAKNTAETQANAEAQKKLAEAHKAAVDAAQADFQNSVDTFQAKRAEADASKAVVEAVAEEQQARRAAAGDSDEYRNALAAVSDAERQEAQAAKATRDAQVALTDAREQARRSLEDERLANERSIITAERAALALEDQRKKLAEIQDDPRATATQKKGAALDLRDAELSLQEAQLRRTRSAADLARDEAKGVEGSDAVVAAKQRVIDSLDAQRQAEKRTADAARAAAKVLDNAKQRVVDAEEKVRTAVLNEADARRAVAEKTGDATLANDAYIQSLKDQMGLLDPNSKFRQDLASYIADLERLAAVRYAADLLPTGDVPRTSTGAPIGGPAPLPVNPTITKDSSGVVHIGPGKTANITINQRNGATAAEIQNELAFNGGGN